MRPGLKQGPEVWWELTVRAMPCRHVTSFLPRLAYADCLGWSLKGGLCIPSPQKSRPRKSEPCESESERKRIFNFLHIFSNFIWFWFTSSLNAPWAKPATCRCRSIVIWWINISASLDSWDWECFILWVKKWPLQHLILLTYHLVQATRGAEPADKLLGEMKWSQQNQYPHVSIPWQRIDKWQWKQSKPWHFYWGRYFQLRQQLSLHQIRRVDRAISLLCTFRYCTRSYQTGSIKPNWNVRTSNPTGTSYPHMFYCYKLYSYPI